MTGMADWYLMKSGVMQEDSIYSTLITGLIKHAAAEIYHTSKDIKLGNETLHVLLDANDIIILEGNTENAQCFQDVHCVSGGGGGVKGEH